MNSDILVVDDEPAIAEQVAGILTEEGFTARTALNDREFVQAMGACRPAMILLDIWLRNSDRNGLEILEDVVTQHPDIPVVMISGHGNVETAVSAIKVGAYDYIEKPFNADRLVIVVRNALEAARLKREIITLRSTELRGEPLVGFSLIVQQLRSSLEKISMTNARVLLIGEPGTGKEEIARHIHERSARSGGPFHAINTAAIPDESFNRTLFGTEHEPGGVGQPGALEMAHGGTLYLHEISEMPSESQTRLLRILTEPKVRRIGGKTGVQVDIRIIASTSKDLLAASVAGEFRADLYHRLAVLPLKIPSLQDRSEDMTVLAETFGRPIATSLGVRFRVFSEDAIAILQSCLWPGNLRQLRNTIERIFILMRDEPPGCVETGHLPNDLTARLPGAFNANRSTEIFGMDLRRARVQFEREFLSAQLHRFGGNVSRTARQVGMERAALHRKLKSLGLTSKTLIGTPPSSDCEHLISPD